MNIDLFTFLMAALATFRVSLMWTKEQGPAKVFKKARSATKPASGWRKWITCIFCFSMTVSAFMCGLLWWAGLREHPAHWVMIWFGLSALTVILNQKYTKGPL